MRGLTRLAADFASLAAEATVRRSHADIVVFTVAAVLISVLAQSSAQAQPSIRGTVLGPSGPQAGALVSVHSCTVGSALPSAGLTDARGHFRLTVPPCRAYVIEASHGNSLYAVQTVRRIDSQARIVVTLVLKKSESEVVAAFRDGPCNTCEVIDHLQRLPVSRSYPPTRVRLPAPHQ